MRFNINGFNNFGFNTALVALKKTIRALVLFLASTHVLTRFTVVLLITALLVPLFSLNFGNTVSAQRRRSQIAQAPPIISTPPEPFVIAAGNSFLATYFTLSLAASIGTIGDFFSTPQLPAEFSSAKVPSTGENLMTSFSAVLGFFAPSNVSSEENSMMYQPSANVDFDFDGDGKTDISRWQPSTKEWRVKKSSDGNITNLTIGDSSDILAPGDFDGDDITDRVTFNAGTWKVKQSSNGSYYTVNWGTTGDKPVAADYDGDDITDFAIYRPSTNAWWIYYSATNTYAAPSLGTSGDVLVQADYDGDNKADLAVYRPSSGTWYVTKSSGGSTSYNWGLSSDVPVPADYDYDGKTDYAVYRPSTGVWWILKSSTGGYTADAWGNYGDQPVPGDYDGDHKADKVVWRPTKGAWYIWKSSNGSYDTQLLGQGGDIAVPSAYTKQVGSLAFGYDLAKERLSPKNATGGTDYYSRNFSWNTGLAGLPGRGDLDAGLGISYNSLVWTKQGSNVFFDTDYSNVGPGFRMGFPTIEPIYYDSTTSKYNYLMVTPSGARVEFRQTAASNTYETADSSYLQLKTTGATNPNDPVENITITVYGTDGGQMTYTWKAGAFHCSQIKDRNGNYITIAHDTYGALTSITDTLGRVITVNYDSEGYPTTITQTWKDSNGLGSNVTHTYATLSYTTKTVSTNFDSGLAVYGPPSGTVLKVLDKVTYGDQYSYTKFDYNGYVQVSKIRNYAADNHLLNSVTTNLNDLSGTFTDCPRLSYAKNWAQNFNGDTNGVESDGESVTVYNEYQENASDTMPDSLTGTKTKTTVYTKNYYGSGSVIVPDGLISNTYYRASGWNEGLPIAAEDCLTNCTGSNRKRWTSTYWTQDDTGVSYLLNPRVTETKVGDGASTKRTTLGYYSTGSPATYPYGLVNEVKQYDTNQTTVLKKTTTDYNLSSTYTDRRIIGLPATVQLYDSSNNLASKLTYGYDDESSFTFESSSYGQNPSSLIQHDNTNYGASFISGRGNLTSVTRWDVNYPTSSGYAVTSGIKHNTAGSAVAKIDAAGRKLKIEYDDNFNDTTTSRNTYAYPTKVTEMANTEDSGNNYTTIKYRFDMGINVETTSPHPDAQTHGKKTKKVFDSVGRLERASVYINTTEQSYVRYEFPTNGIQHNTYATLVNVDGDGNIAEDEVLTESWTDGMGRVRRVRSEHPGSTGGWSATLTEYDVLGRAWRTSVPTEVSVSGTTWTPAGDDDRGLDENDNPIWLWNSREFDWKNRITRSINPDSNGSDGKDKLFSYDGCGCAGGQVTTMQSEETSAGRRTTKVYQDILGREYQSEVLNYDTSVYTATVNTFDARDQITQVRQYSGSTSSSYYRDVTMGYDGHGRMTTRHYPIENAYTNTTWAYNVDDTVDSITDPRGVVANFDYNSRGLLETISYDPGSTGITDTANVGYSYDALKNKTQMTDGTGSTSYAYDELSQIASETKYITELNENFTINYSYSLSGGLTGITDPQDADRVAVYVFDKIGRPTEIDQKYDGTVKQKMYDTKYRAWGALKGYRHLVTGSFAGFISYNYDARQQISGYEAGHSSGGSDYADDGMDFDRTEDGKLSYATNQITGGRTFDRNFTYDHVGRLTHSFSGRAAHGIIGTNVPYRLYMAYNAYSDMTETTGKHWEVNVPDFNPTVDIYSGRLSTSGYDAAGNVTSDRIATYPTTLNRTLTYDAAGRNISSYDPRIRTSEGDTTLTNTFDGNGWQVKHEKYISQANVTGKTFDISSTVLGGATVATYSTSTYDNVDRRSFIVPANDGEMKTSQVPYWSIDSYDMLLIAPEGMKQYNGQHLGDPETEFDARASALGIDNPYAGGGSPGGSYPGLGDGTNFSRCAYEGQMMPCNVRDGLVGYRNRVEIPLAAIREAGNTKEEAGSSPHEPAPKVPVSTAMHSAEAYATTSTRKPEEDPKKGDTIDPAFVPGWGGSFTGTVTEEEDSDVTLGPPTGGEGGASVTVRSRFEDLDYASAATSFNTFTPPTACSRMVNVLANIVREVIEENAGLKEFEKLSHDGLDDAVTTIDLRFAKEYLGVPLNSLANAASLFSGPSISPAGGQDGFKPKFQEGTNKVNDQTHHFAAYFSGGINNMYYTTLAHYAADNNDADRLLGTEAYALGEGLNKKSSTLTTRGLFGIPIITTVDENTKDRARRIMNVASRVKSYVCSSY